MLQAKEAKKHSLLFFVNDKTKTSETDQIEFSLDIER